MNYKLLLVCLASLMSSGVQGAADYRGGHERYLQEKMREIDKRDRITYAKDELEALMQAEVKGVKKLVQQIRDLAYTSQEVRRYILEKETQRREAILISMPGSYAYERDGFVRIYVQDLRRGCWDDFFTLKEGQSINLGRGFVLSRQPRSADHAAHAEDQDFPDSGDEMGSVHDEAALNWLPSDLDAIQSDVHG